MVRTRDRRHAPIAARLTGSSLAAATGALIDREVVLDWPAACERTRAGRALVETTANLVVRFCPQVRIRPTTTLAAHVADHIVAIDSTADPAGSTSRDPLAVHLGGGRQADVTGSAHGWVAFVSGTGEELPPIREDDQVLGAHVAAGFVASQVFVRALRLDTQVAGPTARTAYSAFEYGPPTGEPPAIARSVIDGVLLGGCGAVGQACVDVLVSADVRGLLPVVDVGLVDDPTNLNRSVLAVERDLLDVAPKAQLAARRAKDSPLAVEPVQRPIAEVVAAIEAGERPWPSVVLSAFDNRLARWALQGLWPNLVLEGATGDTMAQVFRHAHGEATACLRCLHPGDGGDRNYVRSMAQATGLDMGRIAGALAGSGVTVTTDDVDAADPAIRAMIKAHVGRDMCGLLSNVERLLGARPAPAELSVAFTSYLAGTFLAGELIKHAGGLTSPLVGRYQIDPVANLNPDPPFLQRPSDACFCQVRTQVVNRIRDEHGSGRR